MVAFALYAYYILYYMPRVIKFACVLKRKRVLVYGVTSFSTLVGPFTYPANMLPMTLINFSPVFYFLLNGVRHMPAMRMRYVV